MQSLGRAVNEVQDKYLLTLMFHHPFYEPMRMTTVTRDKRPCRGAVAEQREKNRNEISLNFIHNFLLQLRVASDSRSRPKAKQNGLCRVSFGVQIVDRSP